VGRWQGGLVFWGSIIGGFVALAVFVYKRRIPLAIFADFAFLGIPLAQVFGRFGCVAAGCCWGMPVYHLDEAGKVVQDIPLAMRFPPGSLAYSSLFESGSMQARELMLNLGTTVPLFPSQIAEAFGTAIIFFILLWMSPRKRFHGQIMFSYAILYSIMRSTLEMFRGDAGRGLVFDHISTSQFISLGVITASLIAMFWLHKRGQPKAVEQKA
jgi:phosphatidylglycerol:prolipoprotein diacylglycerol transferase